MAVAAAPAGVAARGAASAADCGTASPAASNGTTAAIESCFRDREAKCDTRDDMPTVYLAVRSQ
ncbi:hypothetical protein GCM10023170_072190 [Phytohabitans houttuyneae]|uniref:Uncharacterized protein n=1 Tax=Phytohabitans houttuyneae TaxID=1076126 RepID=A0A6V8KJM1_9ACTN|nr:hypothetical protein Phou_050550 [Phytohabitans houttuyneae]